MSSSPNKHGTEVDLLTFAGSGNLALVRNCLAAKLNVNCCDSQGRTPLHKAAEKGHVTVVKYLGELPEIEIDRPTTNDGWSALHLAAGNGHTEVVENLIKMGADVQRVDKFRRTALHRAAFKGHIDVMKMLHVAGASIQCTDRDGDTPLHDAYSGGHLEAAKYLVEHGAVLRATNVAGKTPIECAAHTLQDPVHYPFAEHDPAIAQRKGASNQPTTTSPNPSPNPSPKPISIRHP